VVDGEIPKPKGSTVGAQKRKKPRSVIASGLLLNFRK